MSEVRTTSSTGGQKGVKPERHDLIPRKGMAAIARVFGFGALKYADHNWRRRYEWGKSIAAMQRHIDAFVDGETYDLCPGEPRDCAKWSEEHQRCLEHSGEHHLAQAAFHILVLITWIEEDGEGADNPFDDRWPAIMERLRRADAEDEGGFVEILNCGLAAGPVYGDTGTTSDIPSGLGDFEEGVNVFAARERARAADVQIEQRFTGDTKQVERLVGEAAMAYMTQGRLKD